MDPGISGLPGLCARDSFLIFEYRFLSPRFSVFRDFLIESKMKNSDPEPPGSEKSQLRESKKILTTGSERFGPP